MIIERLFQFRPDPPNSGRLRRSFHVLWILDMTTAVFLILVPYASEVNPVTVFLYGLFGYPGVVLAAGLYATVVVAVGHFLSHPADLTFLVGVVVLYVYLVFNNVVVLAFEQTLAGLSTVVV